jgi:hypothetical protein
MEIVERHEMDMCLRICAIPGHDRFFIGLGCERIDHRYGVVRCEPNTMTFEEMGDAIQWLIRHRLVHGSLPNLRDFSRTVDIRHAFSFPFGDGVPPDMKLLGTDLSLEVIRAVAGDAAAYYDHLAALPPADARRWLLRGWKTWDNYVLCHNLAPHLKTYLHPDPAQRPLRLPTAALAPLPTLAAAAAPAAHGVAVHAHEPE